MRVTHFVVRTVAVLGIALIPGCTLTPAASVAEIQPGATIDCGPVLDLALCHAAGAVAAGAKLNAPPISVVRIRRPTPDDPCATSRRPCGPDAIIVVIQSGDTLQDVPLIRSGNGWILLAAIR